MMAPSSIQAKALLLGVCLFWNVGLIESSSSFSLSSWLQRISPEATESQERVEESLKYNQLVPFRDECDECIAHVTETMVEGAIRLKLACSTENKLLYRIPSVDTKWIFDKMISRELISDETIMTLPPDAMLNLYTYEIVLPGQLPGLLKDESIQTDQSADQPLDDRRLNANPSPSSQPSKQPSSQPSKQPSSQPSKQPSSQPSKQPSSMPSLQPSNKPTLAGSQNPSKQPSSFPSLQPSIAPSKNPSSEPSGMPSLKPSKSNAPSKSQQPSSKPSGSSKPSKSFAPSMQPSTLPSLAPSNNPTPIASMKPSGVPSTNPSSAPSGNPSLAPSKAPSVSEAPSLNPSGSGSPSSSPSGLPSQIPSLQPSQSPSVPGASANPTNLASSNPSAMPSTASQTPSQSNKPTGTPTKSFEPSFPGDIFQRTPPPTPITPVDRISTIAVELGLSGLTNLDPICTGFGGFINQGIKDVYGSSSSSTVTCAQQETLIRGRDLQTAFDHEKPILITVATRFPDFNSAPRNVAFTNFLEELVVSDRAQTELPNYLQQAVVGTSLSGETVHLAVVNDTNQQPQLVVVFGGDTPSANPSAAPSATSATPAPVPTNSGGCHISHLVSLLFSAAVAGMAMMDLFD